MIKLDGHQREQLCLALTRAFPSKGDLEQMVSFELDISLNETINHNGNLSNMVFELVNWAVSKGYLASLITGACNQNKDSPELLTFYKQTWQALIQSELSASVADQSQSSIGETEPRNIRDNHYLDNGTPISSNLEKKPVVVNEEKIPQIEHVRRALLVYSNNVRQAIQKHNYMLAEDREIFIDQYHVAFSQIKEISEILQNMLRALLECPFVPVEISYKIEGIQTSFMQELEKFGLFIGSLGRFVSSLHVRTEMQRKLAVLEQKLQQLDHLINSFCDQLDKDVVVDQVIFLAGDRG